MEIYENIRNLREDNDLTQTDVAKILHISQRAYSHYETGSREIPIPFLIELSKYYNVSIDYLLGQTKIKKRYPAKWSFHADSIIGFACQ